jgi:hypothetical protein
MSKELQPKPARHRALRLALLLALTVTAAFAVPTASALAADCGPSQSDGTVDPTPANNNYSTFKTPDGFFYDIFEGNDGVAGSPGGDGAGTLNDGSYDTDGDGTPDRTDAVDTHGTFFVSDDPAATQFAGYDNPDTNGCSFEEGGRQVVYPADTTSLPGVSLTRKVYVPASTTFHFARFLNCMTNTGTAARTVAYQTGGNLGSDSATQYDATSDGNTTFDANDRWASTNDGGTGDPDPTVAVAWDSNVSDGALDRADVVGKDYPSGPIDPSDDTPNGDSQGFSYRNVTLATGQTKCFAFFLAMRNTAADATAAAAAMGANPTALSAGLSAAERAQVQNWDFAPPASDAAVPTCTRTGNIGVTVTDNGRTGPNQLRYAVDSAAQQTAALSGDPASTTVHVTNGRHTLAYQSTDDVGNLEDLRTEAVLVDSLRPGLTVRSDQHKTVYRVGQRASITTKARDHGSSGLRTNPSKRKQRLSTRRRGRFAVRKTAIDRCGNRKSVRFSYRVLAAQVRSRARPHFTG